MSRLRGFSSGTVTFVMIVCLLFLFFSIMLLSFLCVGTRVGCDVTSEIKPELPSPPLHRFLDSKRCSGQSEG